MPKGVAAFDKSKAAISEDISLDTWTFHVSGDARNT